MLSCNPFAPGLDEWTGGTQSGRGDQTTIEGVFQNLAYAYTISKDTNDYGPLIHGNFEFIYTDYDIGQDISWGREDEMRITHALFKNVQRLDLIWNQINSEYVNADSTEAIVNRTFELWVTFNPNDRPDLNGKAIFTMRRLQKEDPWMIVRWKDEAY